MTRVVGRRRRQGGGGIVSLIATAALWAAVGSFVRRLPVPLVVLVALVAVVLLWRSRRRR